VASTEHESGSDRGRPLADREAAFQFFASLSPGQRTYAEVAAEFGVSARTVERWGREGRWRLRLQEIDAQAARELDAELSQTRVEEIRKIRRLIEATLIGYAEQLRRGMRMTPADLERMFKLLQLLEAQLDAPATPSTPPKAESARTPAHITDVLAALADTGALERFGLTTSPESHPGEGANG
jgi:hypothetical protein